MNQHLTLHVRSENSMTYTVSYQQPLSKFQAPLQMQILRAFTVVTLHLVK